jgi:hypothetical protein
MKWAFFTVALFVLSGVKAQTVQRQMATRAIIRPDTTFTIVNGTVKDPASGSPMPGCSVRLKGKTIGTLTDSRGMFSISATYRDTIIVSFLGYSPAMISLKSNVKNVQQQGLSIDLQYISPVATGADIPYAARRSVRRDTSISLMQRPKPITSAKSRKPDDIQAGRPAAITRMAKADINSFPFPPPEGYTQRVLDKSMFANCKTLEDADQIILNAIDHCRYDDHSYYAIPDGFALVTKVEEMNQDGSSVLGNDRFRVNRGLSMTIFDWFAPRRGYFRVFAFLVTDSSFKATKKPVSVDEAEGWVTQGVNVLPDEIGGEAFSDDYRCTVIVYEFNAPDANVQLQLINPPRLTANTHLDKSNISRFLIP